MSENLVTLIAVRAKLTSRWAVGTVASADAVVKMPVMVDPRTEEPWIPGASIAGSLKSHLGEQGAAWLGPDPEGFEESTGNRDRVASRLAVLGAVITPAERATSGSTQIDPRRGAATGRTLRDYEWAAPTTVTLAFQHDGGADEDLLGRLRTWAPYFGRGRSSGLGECEVTQVDAKTVDLGTAEGLAFWLGERAGWFTAPSSMNPSSVVARAPWLEFSLVAREPLHVGNGDKPLEGSHEVLEIIRQTNDGVPIVPGTSWKGVFRHRIHTILDAVGAEEAERKGVLGALFGTRDSGRGALWFGETLLPAACVTRTHVAIDRFTGGAREGHLFTVRAVKRGSAVPLRIRWARGEMPEPVANLVRHVVRDLHDGLISIGGMGTRGYGWVELAPGTATDRVLANLQPVRVADLLTSLGRSAEPSAQSHENEVAK